MTDWEQVAKQAAAAAAKVIGGAWGQVQEPAVAQIRSMAQAAAQTEIDYAAGRLTKDEYQSLEGVQKDAFTAVLCEYEAIALLTVEQAVDAAWAVFETALQAVIKFP